MGFTYEDEELEFTYKGVTHKFRAPSAVEQKQLSKKFRDAANDENVDASDLYIEMFVMLGLPLETMQKLSMRGLTELFSYTVGAKKN